MREEERQKKGMKSKKERYKGSVRVRYNQASHFITRCIADWLTLTLSRATCVASSITHPAA